jgi:hypothetical protein
MFLMKIKYAQLEKSLGQLRGLSPQTELDISVREENIENGVLGECLVLRGSGVSTPSSYDDVKTDTTHEYTLEVFADSENRPARLTVMTTRDLVWKKT